VWERAGTQKEQTLHLKRLQIAGFKSFADKTDLQFHPGVTAIVGPNGAGKSNISDAIVWALGERSMKALRGSKPLDVIFTGNGSRKGVGLAEVSLTLDNSDGALPVEFSEVTVTRRLFRDGETAYLINQSPCRLRDIHELFFDTGIGADAYSIVNQSGIDAVLSIRAEDRRELFEEAAGVKKYRAKRDEAKRKLDRTEENLVRIRDIVHEIESQLEPLAEQVTLALEYENHLTRLRELQLSLLAWEYDVRLKRTGNLREQRATVEQQTEESRRQLSELEAKEATLDRKLREMEKEIASLQQNSTNVVSDVRSTEGEIAVAEERIRSFVEQKELLEQDSRILRERVESARQERESVASTVTGLEESCRLLSDEVEEKERLLLDCNNAMAASTAQLNRHKSEYIELMRQTADKKNRIAGLEATLSSFHGRLQTLENVAASTTKERQSCETSLTEVSAELAELQRQLEGVQSKLREARIEQARLWQQREDIQAAIGRSQTELSRVQSRLNTLKEMEEHFEGLYAGVKATLQARREDRLTGEFNLIADILRVPKEYEIAVEVALGNALQQIVTTDDGEATRAIEYLKQTRGGRATFLPLNLLRPRQPSASTHSLSQSSGARGIATNLVAFDERFRPAVEYLLNRVLIVDNLQTAIHLSRSAESGTRLVSLEGEVIIPGGGISGGHGKQSTGGLLARKRAIGELEKTSAQLAVVAQQEERSLESAQLQLQQNEQEIKSLEGTRSDLQTAQARQERESEHLGMELRRLDDVIAQVGRDRREIESEMDASRETQGQLQTGIAELERDGVALEQTIDRVQTALTGSMATRDELSTTLGDARIRKATQEEKLTAARNHIAELVRASTEAEQSLVDKQAAVTTGAAESEGLAMQVARSEMRLEVLRERQKQMEQAFDDWRNGRRDTLDALEESSVSLRQLRAALHESEMELHRIELRETQTQTEMEEMERRFQEDYQTSPQDSLNRKEGIENKQNALEEAATLRDRIASMGEVDLGAIRQQKNLKERLEFLGGQHTDLEKAKSELEEIISEIDQRTREQFLNTFENVQREFHYMFQRIFDGGETQLSLTNPENLLETGIDVTVQLPGKAPQELSLLSGGERALTALALLMGLLRVKPSPFCILDEVDAPLDESRVVRFGELVREFAENSQFLIITHNRGTMEVADQLYGVTMEEQGISKLVSVRMSDVEQREVT